VFFTFNLSTGYIGAALNTIGGIGFLVGAILGFWPELGFQSCFAYGVGSLIFASGSAAMIIMWKDEQFGLTFLAVLNHLGGPNGRPLVKKDDGEEAEEEKTLSFRGACFIMIYCVTGTISVYDFLIVFGARGWTKDGIRVAERAFNALLPFIFSHMMLALNAGVYKTPRMAPFHQLYIACRWLALIMAANSGIRVYQALSLATDYTYGPCEVNPDGGA